MAAVAIKNRLCQVVPVQPSGPKLEGVDEPMAVDAWSVPLSGDYVERLGGAAPRVGELWQVRLGLRYRAEDGTINAVDLTGLETDSLRLRIWNANVGHVATRAEGVAIGTLGFDELQIDGAATLGNVLVTIGPSETITPGRHRWRMTGEFSANVVEGVAAGTIEIPEAAPEATP